MFITALKWNQIHQYGCILCIDICRFCRTYRGYRRQCRARPSRCNACYTCDAWLWRWFRRTVGPRRDTRCARRRDYYELGHSLLTCRPNHDAWPHRNANFKTKGATWRPAKPLGFSLLCYLTDEPITGNAHFWMIQSTKAIKNRESHLSLKRSWMIIL